MSATGETLAFLRALYAPYAAYSSACVEVRCFPPAAQKGNRDYPKPPRRWYPLTRSGIRSCASDVSGWGAQFDCYMGVLPRVKGGGGAEHVRLCSWLWVDIDGGAGTPDDAAELLIETCHGKGLPRPHMIVCSGGGLHCYFRLSEMVKCRTRQEQERIRKVLLRLVRLIGGDLTMAHADKASTDPARILRLAGTYNHKRPDARRDVTLQKVYPDDPAHPLVWWEAFLPAEPLPAATLRAANGKRNSGNPPIYTHRDSVNGPGLYRATVDKITHAAPDGAKHYTMVSVAVAAAKQGLGEEAVRNYAEQVGVVSGVDMNDPQQQRHLEGIVDWTMRTITPDPG